MRSAYNVWHHMYFQKHTQMFTSSFVDNMIHIVEKIRSIHVILLYCHPSTKYCLRILSIRWHRLHIPETYINTSVYCSIPDQASVLHALFSGRLSGTIYQRLAGCSHASYRGICPDLLLLVVEHKRVGNGWK